MTAEFPYWFHLNWMMMIVNNTWHQRHTTTAPSSSSTNSSQNLKVHLAALICKKGPSISVCERRWRVPVFVCTIPPALFFINLSWASVINHRWSRAAPDVSGVRKSKGMQPPDNNPTDPVPAGTAEAPETSPFFLAALKGLFKKNL